MKIAYLVSRFPVVSETFVVREIDAVSARPGLEVELRALYPPKAEGMVQPISAPWVPRVLRPAPAAALAAVGWWAARRPLRLARTLATVVAGHARHPHELVRALATFPVAAWHARDLLATGADHVHAHFAHYPALTAWIAHELTGVSYSFTAHANDIFAHHAMLARKASDARFVAAISAYNRDYLRARGARAPVYVVRCGVDPAAYPFATPAPANGEPPRVLCVAGLREYKGQDVLLRAVAQAPPRLARAHVDLVGDGELRAELEALAGRLGISDRVTFHGSLPVPAVAAMLRSSHVFVAPSVVAADGDMDGVPVALMEALAAGVPSVSTRLSGIPELVQHERTGLLAEPGDPAALAAALEATLADPDAARERAAAGRALVEREFDQRRSAEALAAHFAAAGRAADVPGTDGAAGGARS